MATIAEIVFIGSDGCIHLFWVLLLSGEMCCFLHFMQGSFWLGFFGVAWRNVIGPCGAWGLGWVFRFLFILFLWFIWLVFVFLCINLGRGLLVFVFWPFLVLLVVY